jgi:anti-sigma factor ChrR (cupin superfamily)
VEHEEWLERAEIYALGTLEANEAAQFEAHLSAGCPRCQAHLKQTAHALTLISQSLQPLAPHSQLKARIFEQIESEKPGFVFALANEGQWQEMGRGILAKVLYMDEARQRVTALVRMAPGSRYDSHRHTQTEELFILEGSCYCGGRLLRRGDYHRADAGSIHLDTRTEEGSLMLIITSAQNEMLV